MTTLGEGRFSTPITALPGETVLWEGGVGRHARRVRLARVGLLLAIPVLLVLGLVGLMLLDSSSHARQPTPAGTQATHRSADSAQAPQRVARRRVMALLVLVGALGCPLLVLIGIVVVEATLSCRNAWYVVTNERICVQTGALARCLAVIDLDKVLSVQVSSSWLERIYGLQSIELVHGGVKVFAQHPWLVRDPLLIALVPAGGSLASDLINSWLPRDDRAPRS